MATSCKIIYIYILNAMQDQQKRYHRHKIVIEQMKQKSKLLLKSIGIADTSLDKVHVLTYRFKINF